MIFATIFLEKSTATQQHQRSIFQNSSTITVQEHGGVHIVSHGGKHNELLR
nr:MAG TPA: hypothetical protein [Caudoviricetes sp.]